MTLLRRASVTIARVRIAVFFILAAAWARAATDIPMTLVSEDEAEPIHSAILRKEAWTQDSVRRLRAEAEKRLREGPWTVTADRPRDVDLDPHDYYSEAPYWWPNPDDPNGKYLRKDGQPNPARFLANKTALNAMCDAVFALGAAAFLLDDARYAQRARERGGGVGARRQEGSHPRPDCELRLRWRLSHSSHA